MIGPPPTIDHAPQPSSDQLPKAPRLLNADAHHFDNEAITLRLDEICDGLTPSQIAAVIRMPRPSAIQRYLSGFAPSVEFVARLCESFSVSTDWVLLGRGSNDYGQHCRYWLERVETEALVDELQRRLRSATGTHTYLSDG